MRIEHRAGEKLFVDYAGMKFDVADPKTGEVTPLEVFVAAMGASSMTFADLHVAQDVRHWTQGHIDAFEFYWAAPEVLVPDNLKAAVARPCLYELDLNPTYRELAEHYGAVVIPARVRRPRDKAKAENAVLQVARWVLAALRNQTFFSLADARAAVHHKLTELNDKPFSSVT